MKRLLRALAGFAALHVASSLWAGAPPSSAVSFRAPAATPTAGVAARASPPTWPTNAAARGGTRSDPSAGVARKPAAPAVDGGPRRDWAKAPAIVEIDQTPDLYAVSDTHGGYGRLLTLFHANGLVDRDHGDPTSVQWTGKKALLIVNGDIIDKGNKSVETIDLLRSLQKGAAAQGGRVIVTMGNHEAEFLADPDNSKATRDIGGQQTGAATSMEERGIRPEEVARGVDDAGRGPWLRDLPLGVRVKDWFFAHGGNTKGRSMKELSDAIKKGVDEKGFGSKELVGKHSILEARQWYGDPDEDRTARDNAEALGVKHIVFGHVPSALGDRKHIKATSDGVLIKIDTGMGEGAKGHLLHVDMTKPDEAESLSSKGHSRPVL